MPIFISHSHADRDFVDSLAKRLVLAKHHIWLDRWELNLGDSLTSRIQESLTESSAILVILSKSSVESGWCQRELNAGMVRELEERKTIVMPVVIDDCKIPLFLRDKLYANFNKDPDDAFGMIERALAKISNPATGRVERPDFNTDFAMDWRLRPTRPGEAPWLFRFTFLDTGSQLAYSVLSECQIYATAESQRERFAEFVRKDMVFDYICDVAEALALMADAEGLIVKIEDQFEKAEHRTVSVPNQGRFEMLFNYRRLGLDNGMDTVLYLENNLKMALHHIKTVLMKPPGK